MDYSTFRDEQWAEMPRWIGHSRHDKLHPIVVEEMLPYAVVWFGSDRRDKCKIVRAVERRVRCRYGSGIISSIIIGVIIRVIVWAIIQWIERRKENKTYGSSNDIFSEFEGWVATIQGMGLTPPR